MGGGAGVAAGDGESMRSGGEGEGGGREGGGGDGTGGWGEMERRDSGREGGEGGNGQKEGEIGGKHRGGRIQSLSGYNGLNGPPYVPGVLYDMILQGDMAPSHVTYGPIVDFLSVFVFRALGGLQCAHFPIRKAADVKVWVEDTKRLLFVGPPYNSNWGLMRNQKDVVPLHDFWTQLRADYGLDDGDKVVVPFETLFTIFAAIAACHVQSAVGHAWLSTLATAPANVHFLPLSEMTHVRECVHRDWQSCDRRQQSSQFPSTPVVLCQSANLGRELDALSDKDPSNTEIYRTESFPCEARFDTTRRPCYQLQSFWDLAPQVALYPPSACGSRSVLFGLPRNLLGTNVDKDSSFSSPSSTFSGFSTTMAPSLPGPFMNVFDPFALTFQDRIPCTALSAHVLRTQQLTRLRVGVVPPLRNTKTKRTVTRQTNQSLALSKVSSPSANDVVKNPLSLQYHKSVITRPKRLRFRRKGFSNSVAREAKTGRAFTLSLGELESCRSQPSLYARHVQCRSHYLQSEYGRCRVERIEREEHKGRNENENEKKCILTGANGQASWGETTPSYRFSFPVEELRKLIKDIREWEK